MDIYDLLGKIDHTEDQDKVSYSAGVVMAMSLKDMGFEDLKYDDFTEGMKTIFDKMTPKISPKKSIDIFNNYVTLLRHELSLKNEEEGKAFEVVKMALVASVRGYPPQVAVEFARKLLFSDVRPTFSDLEDSLKNKSKAPEPPKA